MSGPWGWVGGRAASPPRFAPDLTATAHGPYPPLMIPGCGGRLPPAEAPFVTRAPVGQGVLAPGSTLGRECGTAFRGGDPQLVTQDYN